MNVMLGIEQSDARGASVRAAPLGLWVRGGREPRVARMLAGLAFAPPWADIGLPLRGENVQRNPGLPEPLTSYHELRCWLLHLE